MRDRARITILKVGGGGKTKASKSRGPRILSPFFATLKLLASQKTGGGGMATSPPPVAWALIFMLKKSTWKN